MSQVRFDGRVALVTGAGGGLGRAYALLLAERGAAVVVNDLGGTARGEGQSSSAADAVVAEIKAKGGKAVANYNSVEDGEKVVQTAIDAFGRLDIVINNAGILRDKTFTRISDQDWDLIHRVHLRGSFMVTRAAWPHLRKSGFGRIIMTASAAGIYGNFGQANYSAAKLGLLGLSNTLAIEGAKYNIYCNTIAPVAGSRLTETVFPEELVKALTPEFVAPVVAYLCHDSCVDNGGLFELGAGWVSKLRWQRTRGAVIEGSMTIENIRDKWGQITDFNQFDYPTSITESMNTIMSHLEKRKLGSDAASSSGAVDVNAAKAHKFTQDTFAYTDRDVILYALGIGAERTDSDLKFLYESADGFAVLPTFGVIPAQAALGQVLAGIPGFEFNLTQLLHGEQYLEVKAPIPTSGTLISNARVSEILDKGKGALLLIDVDTTDQSGQPILFNQFSLFIRGLGGFGGAKTSAAIKGDAQAAVPSRKPDAIEREATLPKQAALYRLSGDLNPIHIDPQMAGMAGFEVPILHGLCSFGYAARHVLKHFAQNDPKYFKNIRVRFAKPVYPGETIQTEMWREGNRVLFQCKAVERNELVLSNSYIELCPNAFAHRGAANACPRSLSAAPTASGLLSEVLMNELARRIPENPDVVKKVNSIFQFNITKDGKEVAQWTVDLKTGAGSVSKGAATAPNCTVTLSDDDFVALGSGKLQAQKAFMSGKLKVKGNIMLATKLEGIFKQYAKEAAAAIAAAQSGAAPAAPAASAGSSSAGLVSDALFAEIGRRVAATPALVQQVNVVYQFNITKGGKDAAQWTIDLKNGAGSVTKAAAAAPGCTITVSDEDFAALVAGTINPQKAFMSGKLKVKGNVTLATKLDKVLQGAKAKL
ncbi:hydroxysteroid dehydrogenase 4 [Capsaspora owczarzaki ATCC 30864]|uniref:Hydroxysteroid dehydrogenase 4 n=1 Tax=Capsaspora owczarzaki (strain ATCC 30864) TaxID=595528 RepID=A0A0D2U863_CAPO3|nr:hydroxysteroid dehydrogenase 4 [Capsaspora owczarzaki ATCC 30864]KJE91296.1 hydroxysteroid dehydrogenase 4 [Capsaspora owczarzaki ATCC 30864]|eukprot:XP_004349202.2 hydroxysteroid dehydrogenase 4 [Capsaspora owczarzaki ATCC 30864]